MHKGDLSLLKNATTWCLARADNSARLIAELKSLFPSHTVVQSADEALLAVLSQIPTLYIPTQVTNLWELEQRLQQTPNVPLIVVANPLWEANVRLWTPEKATEFDGILVQYSRL